MTVKIFPTLDALEQWIKDKDIPDELAEAAREEWKRLTSLKDA